MMMLWKAFERNPAACIILDSEYIIALLYLMYLTEWLNTNYDALMFLNRLFLNVRMSERLWTKL